MTKLTIELPDEVAQRVAHAVAERGVAAEQVAGKAVAEKFPAERFPARRKLWFVGIGASTSGRHASEADEMLADDLGRD